MRNRDALDWLAPVIIILGIIIVIIGETSMFYFPLIYIAIGLGIIAVILIIKGLIKNI